MKRKPDRKIRDAAFLFFVNLCFIAQVSIATETPSNAAYRASLSSTAGRYSSFEGETLEVEIRVQNEGRVAWEPGGRNPCSLSYHLLDRQKNLVRFDNMRTYLPGKILPRQAVVLTAKVKSPLVAGSYELEFDLVLEGLTWFKDRGSPTLFVPLQVLPRVWPEDKYVMTLKEGPFTKFESSQPEFNALLKLIRITLKNNEVAFQGKSGPIHGFSAGAGYPQIWLRDANTIVAASRYFYPASYIFSWLEEHLSLQREDGALFDWVNSKGLTDKNTVETDQEASAVQAAREVLDLLGPAWPAKAINKAPAVARLEKALEFVLRMRFSEKFGLIIGAHTADWGDVDMNRPDQQAVYVDGSTHWTADIYDQSMFYEASRDLAALFDAGSQPDKARLWRERAERIRENTDKRLWQQDKGFYRVHIHLDSLRHQFNEDDMFAMGGNSQAIISGLAGGDKARRIIEQALVRQTTFGLSTISGSLLPPYPAGLFKHPALDEPYEYQNGGQWDWFGARLILGMYENGFSRLAGEKLCEIARKDMANGGFYEWDTKDGSGRGSDDYAGSAGSLARALFEGYFGIKITESKVELSPRLGTDEAKIHVYLPADGRFVAYEYRFNKQEKTILFNVNTNVGGASVLRLLSPWGISGAEMSALKQKVFEVQRDGVPVPFKLERIHEDAYIVLETDLKNRKIEIRYLRPTE